MADTVLSAEEHFESLREAVWVRFAVRHGGRVDRERFDDSYAEWWAREAERAARGAPSRAAAPAAFVAEAVHRVLIDDARARARGLGRDEKSSLDIADIDEQRDVAGSDDTAAAAVYEALAHRLLSLVRDLLSERELRVFVFTYLYLQPSERTAAALGLSLPRVKKDRKKIAGKIGAQVWQVLQGELDLCAVYSEQSLPAVFELMTIHVEDCPTCRSTLSGMQRGAVAAIAPEALLMGATESTTHVVSDLLARAYGVIHRGTDTLAALPPQGRAAAAVAVAATAVAGGAMSVGPSAAPRPLEDKKRVARATPTRSAAAPIASAASATSPSPRPTAAPSATPRPRRRPKLKSTPTPVATAPPAAPSPAPPAPQTITFEQPAPAPEAEAAAAPPPPSAQSQEFGFEGP